MKNVMKIKQKTFVLLLIKRRYFFGAPGGKGCIEEESEMKEMRRNLGSSKFLKSNFGRQLFYSSGVTIWYHTYIPAQC